MYAITLRQIEIFHAVMTTGNLTEAAALLQTSQPTVSRELARFEKLIQLQLFDRVRGRLYPTVQGLRLFEEVQRSYYGLDRIKMQRPVSGNSSRRSFPLPACRCFPNRCCLPCANLLSIVIRK